MSNEHSGVIETGYRPRKQQRYLRSQMRRFNVLVCHRRFGKTVFAINEMIEEIVKKKAAGLKAPRGYYVAPLFRQAKQVAWDYLKDYTRNFPDCKVNQSELSVTFLEDCKITLLGADNPDSARGIYVDYFVLDEYGQMNPKMWTEVLRPACSDRKGGGIFIGTPKGRNGFWKIYKKAQDRKNEDWYSSMYKASQTGIIDENELRQAAEEMTQEEYEQEFECSWSAAILGAYYGQYLVKLDAAGQISDKVKHDSSLPVFTGWDLGMDDVTCIWFAQMVGHEIRIIDYYQATGQGLEHYTQVLGKKNYTYAEHFLPHDVSVRELGTGKSRLETLYGMGLRGRVVQRHSVDDGIAMVRLLLQKCWFNETLTSIGLEALRQYRKEFDFKLDTPKVRPLHDWTSHASDAFRSLAMGLRSSHNLNMQRPAFANQGPRREDFDDLAPVHEHSRDYPSSADNDQYDGGFY